MRPSSTSSLLVAAALVLALIPLLHLLPFQPTVSYTAIFIAASLAYLWFARSLAASDVSRALFVSLIGASLLVRLSFVNTMPIGSDDVYRYMWDGKVQSAGINPYRYPPNAPELEQLHSELLPAAVNHPDMKTLYFPVSQWIFFFVYQISGEQIWGYKILLFLAEIGTILALSLFATRLKLDQKFILLYALCPLPIIQFALDAHLDGLGLPLLVLALLVYLNGEQLFGLALMALSMSIKPVGLVILPIFFFLERSPADKLRVLLVPAIVLVIQFVPYAFSANPFEALTTFTQHWVFNGAVFNALNLYFADNQATRTYCALLLGISLLVLYIIRRPPIEKAYYAILLLLLFSPVVHPWYVAWLAVLLPLVRKWSGIVYASSASLTSFTILTYHLSGRWEEYPVVIILEYLPVLVLLIVELFTPSRTVASAGVHTDIRSISRSKV